MTQRCDIAIVGAGIAGSSLAAELAAYADVILLEAEERPGYHSTGRSAAFWTESYGGPLIQPLTAASGPWLREQGFLAERGALTIARHDQLDLLDAFIAEFSALGVRIDRLDRAGVAAHIPGLRPDWTMGAFEPDCSDIDVAGLHAHYLRAVGPRLRCRANFIGASSDPQGWLLEFGDGQQLGCRILVDAAGAWADDVAIASGVAPLGIVPFRRTVAQVRTLPEPPKALPLVLDIAEQFYFKPEGARVWLSPHDETPSPPCDAAAEEIDVATAVARFEDVVDWQVERVEHRWAGLRSFSPDRLPVYGFDSRVPGFFWFAGQGGFGIQTAPAAAQLAARLVLGGQGGPLDPTRYSPGRFG